MAGHTSNPTEPGRLAFIGDEGNAQPLPEWAKWLYDLGFQLGGISTTGASRTVVAVSVPTSGYGAVFAALGAIVSRSALKPATCDDSGYFDLLRSQPKGTPVILYRPASARGRTRLHRFKGVIDGEGSDQWGDCVNILYFANGDAKHHDCCRRTYCRHVLIQQDAGNGHEAVQNQKGVSVVRDINLFEALVKPEHRVDFLTVPRLDCALVGNKGRLLEELDLGIAAGTAATKGRLTDLVRPRELSNYEQFYRSSICSSEKKGAPSLPAKPHLTIFESSTGFLKWGETFPGTNYLVILDRTEPQFRSAMDTLQNRFLNRMPDGMGLVNIPSRPAGVEVLIFAEASHD